jgi:two-component system sensor histidine kinase KdpD
MDQLRTTFALAGVQIRASATSPAVGSSDIVASSGEVDGTPAVVLPLRAGDPDWQDHRLELFGGRTTADDQRVLRVLADQLAVALETERLARDAAEAAALAEVDAVRTALLRAVSHDLRTPLASIKAMVSGLRDPSVDWTAEQLAEGLATIESETDRLNRLVGNLLDASRLQIGALAVERRPSDLAEIVNSAVESLDLIGSVDVDVATNLPLVDADPALLERALANLVSNAARFTTQPGTVRVDAEVVGDAVLLRVVDRGPGIPADQHRRVLAPFQRLGDQPSASGTGLGLSIAQGFIAAMGATMTLDDTPGGGLTVTVTLGTA